MVKKKAKASGPRGAHVILDLVKGSDKRTENMMPGWDLELAHQRLFFTTTPGEFVETMDLVRKGIATMFGRGGAELRKRCASFLINATDSLNSVVELKHNLQNENFHKKSVLGNDDVRNAYRENLELLRAWEKRDKKPILAAIEEVRVEDLAVNKGDNLFISWALDWQKKMDRDPYGSVDAFLECFAGLYTPSMYYVKLFFALQEDKTNTQFFNDYGLQAGRCRKIGSQGGTTNPAIAVLGENDYNGLDNIHGPTAKGRITRHGNPWTEIRKVLAKEQIARRRSDDLAATAFTEWVVLDAMLPLRSIFLLKGLGRVAFQLRPDWHMEEKKLAYGGGQIYARLCKGVSVFDKILLDGADPMYSKIADGRIGKSNNHFKVSCTGQVALNLVRAFNAGHHPDYPKAVKERMWTNMTLSYDVSQMVASSLAVEEGMKDYQRRTRRKADDGIGGSVVTSMIGRFNDAIRIFRLETLLDALPKNSAWRKRIDPSAIKSLEDKTVNNSRFVKALAKAGIKFRPKAEEDAIDHAGTLLTKRAFMILKYKHNINRTRLLTASKRQFHQNTDLLDVPFSTDFGNIQRAMLPLWQAGKLRLRKGRTIEDGMSRSGSPKPGTVWARRKKVLDEIWPDFKKAYAVGGVKPGQYVNTIYVPPTLNQFTGYWVENVARAAAAREALTKKPKGRKR